MYYRKDIQILRGIAVVLVVLFHLKLNIFKSGFLGVDIFFVISGFLMAILYDNTKKSDFFLKRIKRLLPAYYVTILVTLSVSIFLITPNELSQVVEQSLYANIFLSNIGFWTHNSYFSNAEFNPLLHLWSLGVEIQFYLLLPLLIPFFSLKKQMFPLVLILSLLLCFLIIGVSPKTSFFMTPLRLWEFLIGYGIAKYFTYNGNTIKNRKSWLGLLGLGVVIFLPTLPINGNSYSFVYGHPGVYSLVISMAVATILLFGLPLKIEHSKIGIFFENIGKYSYSIYLVHFPLIVLFLYRPFSGTELEANSISKLMILIIFIIGLSVLMYYFVENHFRQSKKIKSWLLIFPILVFSLEILGTSIQKNIFTEKEMLIFNAFKDRDTYRCGKLFRILSPTENICKLTENIDIEKKRILLLGNSHADSIKKTFSNIAMSLGINTYFMRGNRPLLTGGITAEEILEIVLINKINNIVMHYSPGALSGSTIKEFILLAEDNKINISFIMPVPVWESHIPEVMWKYQGLRNKLPRQTLKEYNIKNEELYVFLSSIRKKNFKFYTVNKYFCNNECRFSNVIGKPYYFDTMHLTLTGSKVLTPLFKIIMTDILNEESKMK